MNVKTALSLIRLARQQLPEDELSDIIELLLPPIEGAAPLDSFITAVTATTALTNVEVGIGGLTGVVIPGSGPGRQAPPALAFAYAPQVTGLAAAATCSLTLRNGVAIAATQFGGGTATNSGAGASAVGPLLALGLAPVGCENVFAGAVVSSGTGTLAGAATAPALIGALMLD